MVGWEKENSVGRGAKPEKRLNRGRLQHQDTQTYLVSASAFIAAQVMGLAYLQPSGEMVQQRCSDDATLPAVVVV